MSNNHNKIEEARNEMSLKLMDVCNVLTAIEVMFSHSAITREKDGRVSGPLDSVHGLVCLALEKACAADSLSDELENLLIAARPSA